MRRTASLLTALILLLLPLAACGDETLDEFSRLSFRGRNIISGGVVIALNGEIVYQYAYGTRDDEKDHPATVDTCYHAASVTKMVSAIGLLHLMEEKNLSLDTAVKDIVGFPVVNPAFPEVDITVRQVLSHTTSILESAGTSPDWESIQKFNNYYTSQNAPGTVYAYSNLNGGLIGAMIEALSGKSVNTYMQEQIFGPLHINAAYHAGLLPDQSDISAQRNTDGSISASVRSQLYSIGMYDDTCNPRAHTNITSGSLRISPNGLIRILMLLENGGELDGVRLLSEETVQLMMQDQSTVEGSSVKVSGPYGLCLKPVEDMPGGTWYGHQGVWAGVTANAYFQPDTGLCVAVIANGYSSIRPGGVTTIARTFMEKAQEFLH